MRKSVINGYAQNRARSRGLRLGKDLDRSGHGDMAMTLGIQTSGFFRMDCSYLLCVGRTPKRLGVNAAAEATNTATSNRTDFMALDGPVRVLLWRTKKKEKCGAIIKYVETWYCSTRTSNVSVAEPSKIPPDAQQVQRRLVFVTYRLFICTVPCASLLPLSPLPLSLARASFTPMCLVRI